MKQASMKAAVVLVVMALAACVTVNIYFPAAEVQKAAEEIVKQVRGSEAAPESPEGKDESQQPGPGPVSYLIRICPVSTAFAAQELTVSNATIRQIKARMQQRYGQLKPFFQRGVIGENAKGYLVIKDQGAVDLRSRALVKRLVEAENRDRKALYAAVAQALKIPASQIARVERIFAGQWQKSAPKGSWIEQQPGKWVRK